MTEEKGLAVQTENNFYLAPAANAETILRAYQTKHDIIEKVLRVDLDYGTVPGSTKPALLKPGAEKLANMFALAPQFDDVVTIEDWTGAEHGGEPFFYYRQKCNLYKGDKLMGSADGSCNSWEKKYRYRNGDRVCPECGKPTIFKSKPPKTGFYCWSKKGGCGAQFNGNDARITEQVVGQIPNPDIAEQVNTILKMAQKRALVAATLIVTGASDYFTQDIDDFVQDGAVDGSWMPEASNTNSNKQSTQEPEFEPQSMTEAAEALGAVVTPAPAPAKREANKRPFTPDELRKNFNKAVATIEAKGLLLGPDDFKITENAVWNLLDNEGARQNYLQFVTGIPYLEDMNEAQIVALLRLLKPTMVDGAFIPLAEAKTEATAVIAAVIAAREGGAA